MQLKTLLKLTLCSAVLMGFASCSDDDDNNPNNPGGPSIDPVVPGLTTDMTNEGYYKADYYGVGTGNLFINFMSNNLEWDDMEEDYTGNGDIICIDFNTVLAANPDQPSLADGTYNTDTDGSYAEYTINVQDDESYVTKYANGSSTDYVITAATLAVSTENGVTTIEGDLTLDDQSTYNFIYIGHLNIYNRSGEGKMSNLTENVTVSDLTQGLALYYGEAYTETSDHYMVMIAGADYDLYENFGNAPCVMFGLNVTPGSTTGIPSGTYTLIDAMTADDYEVGTALSGVYDPTYGAFGGSWYFFTGKTLEAAMQTGTINVTNNGDGTYAFTFNVADGYGHTITGSYNGAIAIEDLSE